MITKLFNAQEARINNKIDIVIDHINKIIADLDDIYQRLDELEKHYNSNGKKE